MFYRILNGPLLYPFEGKDCSYCGKIKNLNHLINLSEILAKE